MKKGVWKKRTNAAKKYTDDEKTPGTIRSREMLRIIYVHAL
jgi:hypothetical protein